MQHGQLVNNAGRQELHLLPGMLFTTLSNNLALPCGDPIIKRLMPHFLRQQDIQELEAMANGNLLMLSHDALQRMSQRYGVTLSRLLSVLANFDEAHQVFALLNQPNTGPERIPSHPSSVFQQRIPPDGVCTVDAGGTAVFRVILHERYRQSTELTWHKWPTHVILCRDNELRIKNASVSDQGQYSCMAKVSQQQPGAPRPVLMFSLKVRDAPVPVPEPAPVPVLVSLPMERSHKYALIVSCQKYRNMQSLGCDDTRDLQVLQGHLESLAYRTILLLNPCGFELRYTIVRLKRMLAQCTGLAPYLFLLLDGHGTVIQTENRATSCFLPVDAQLHEPSTFLRVEEDIILPLDSCLRCTATSTDDGLLVAVFDICRSLQGSARAADVGHIGMSVRDKRIQRLHSTSYAETAAALVDRSNTRRTFAVAALNQRLSEGLANQDLLQPQTFLHAVSETISRMSHMYHTQSPEVQVSTTKASLSELVLLSDMPSIMNARHVLDKLRPKWRKLALLIGASRYKACGDGLQDLLVVPKELQQLEGALQLLGFHTVVHCDRPGGLKALLDAVKSFCGLLELAAKGAKPVQALLLVDGHGKMSVDGSSLFLVPSGSAVEPVDVEDKLAQPLYRALAKAGQPRLLWGFYDICRSAPPAELPWGGVRTTDSPDYCRFFAASAHQTAHALSTSGSYGVSALLRCLRESRYNEEALRPVNLLPKVAELISQDTHRNPQCTTQYPAFSSPTVRTSLANDKDFLIEDLTERQSLALAVWEMLRKYRLLTN